jgi:hypothetical protein
MIPADIRRPYLAKYKRALREALQSPGTSTADREKIAAELQRAGQRRDYSKADPKPWAIYPGPLTPGVTLDDLTDKTPEELMALSHKVLYQAAKNAELEVESSHTKAQIIQVICQSQEEQP